MDCIPSKLVADFYEANLDAAYWPQALLALCEWLGADLAGFLTHDFDSGDGRFQQVIGLSAEAQSSYRRQHARSNPWLQAEEHFRRTPAVVRGSAIMDADSIRASGFYRNWLKNTGLGAHLFAVVARRDSRVTTLVLARNESKPDFDDAAVAHLETLVPSLMRALQAGLSLTHVRNMDRAALRAIDAMPIGIIVLDRSAVVLEANRFARTILDAGEGLTAATGTLTAEIGGRRLKLRDLLVRLNDRGALMPSDEVSILPVPRPSGQRPLTLLLTPLDLPAEAEDGPAALLFVGDPERPATFDQTRIARLYGLSRAESRVAALLASGYRLEQVAEALDIAYETVRKHLKQIFGKTGTYRQAELVRMLVTGPAGLGI
jgi:DNA-binding CsgD family transcriptional regulator/PAS domain-containing protein